MILFQFVNTLIIYQNDVLKLSPPEQSIIITPWKYSYHRLLHNVSFTLILHTTWLQITTKYALPHTLVKHFTKQFLSEIILQSNILMNKQIYCACKIDATIVGINHY